MDPVFIRCDVDPLRFAQGDFCSNADGGNSTVLTEQEIIEEYGGNNVGPPMVLTAEQHSLLASQIFFLCVLSWGSKHILKAMERR